MLGDQEPDAFAGQNVTLHKLSSGEGYNFAASNMSWWAEEKISRLQTAPDSVKRTWTRAARAVALLEHFGTPAARAILKNLTTGHPEAGPTKLAQEALDRLSLNEK